MARPLGSKDEYQLLKFGMDLRAVDKSAGSPWIQNVIVRNGKLEVRSGFGTLARYSTTMSAGKDPLDTPTSFVTSAPFGLQTMLGAYWFLTDDGHEQILTLHTARVYTANIIGTPTATGGTGYPATVFALSVYDVTTDTRQEFILADQTADQAPPTAWTTGAGGQGTINSLYPVGQSQLTQANYQAWVPAKVTTVSFAQLGDRAFIVLAGVGCWVYQPIVPTDKSCSAGSSVNQQGIPQAVDLAHTRSSGVKTQGEAGALRRLRLANGEFASDGIVYFTASDFPAPTCHTAFLNRMVWASGRTILFSEPDRPNVVRADNFTVIPCERNITAVASQFDRLVVFTDDEVWMYQPSVDTALQSGGRAIRLAYGTGCLSPNHLAKINEGLAFVDQRGAYYMAGTSIAKQSTPVDPLWTQPEQAQNPYSNFVTALGFTPWAGLQPRARIDIQGQLQYGKLTWSDYYGTLFITLADVTLCLNPSAKEPNWTVWLYETASVLQGNTPVVGLTRNINAPWLLAGENNLYLASTEVTTYTDQSSPPASVTETHLHLAQLGRGGGVDVSSSKQEDRRQPLGQYVSDISFSPQADQIWLDRAVPQRAPYRTPARPTGTSEDVWLVPIGVQPTIAPIGDFDVQFRFDNQNWLPLLSGAGVGRIDYVVPPERLAGKDGYANVPAASEVALYDSGTGLRSNTGDEVRVFWDGSLLPGPWATMGVPLDRKTPVLYLPFVRRTGTSNLTTLTLGVNNTFARINGGAVNCTYWCESRDYPQQSLAGDALAQPIDWVIKSPQFGLGDNQLKYRGMWMRCLSHGTAATRIPGNSWIYGVLNTLAASDYKDYSGQAVDFVPPSGGQYGDSTIATIATLRDRMQPPSNPNLFKRIGGAQARWGTNTDAALGNFLVDDPEVDTIATSDSVRGEQFSLMAFGNTANPGEHLEVGSVKATVQVVGGKRRGGRQGGSRL